MVSSLSRQPTASYFCFGDQFERRNVRGAAAGGRRLPLACLVDLKRPESGAGFSVDWATRSRPRLESQLPTWRAARYEAKLSQAWSKRCVPVLDAARTSIRTILGRIWACRAYPGYRAVAALQAELGYTIWFSNYVGPASLPFSYHGASQASLACLSVRTASLPTDIVGEPDRITELGLERGNGAVDLDMLGMPYSPRDCAYRRPCSRRARDAAL